MKWLLALVLPLALLALVVACEEEEEEAAIATPSAAATATLIAGGSPSPTDTPTRTAAPTATATGVPSPTAAAVPVDIREVDFSEVLGVPYCTYGPQGCYGIPEEFIVYGDLTGDGEEEAILPGHSGGTAGFVSLWVYGYVDGELQALLAEPAPVGTAAPSYIGVPQVEGGRLIVARPAYGPDDYMCCPSQLNNEYYEWDGSELALVGEETIDNPDVESAPSLDIREVDFSEVLGVPYCTYGPQGCYGIPEEFIVYGDLTGDGQEEAILPGHSGGTAGFVSLWVYGYVDGELEALLAEPAPVGTAAPSYVGVPKVEGGRLIVARPAWGPDDDMCCPSQLNNEYYEWDGSELVLVGEETIDNPNLPP